ncbi:phage terminase [Weissella oryzae SG25]|uniref:Phage terminase n=1 Tax=Weissella oryzae (strain DSM 25784 / JCM 18191 / LMG 30913 / SG25) TaxID=1329250 RepID=A0A069D3J0_WEIOS|nr:phage terminase small subunit P27 family [Weissella oryzae]GAK31961.1 phage terminase [Weissella oryzae SG25]
MKKADKDVNDGRLAYRPPDYLGIQAKAIWRKVVGFLEENAAVNRIDSNLVEMYCTQYEIFRNAYKHIQENGEVQAIYKSVQDNMGNVIATDFVGYKRNPMTQIYDSAIKNLTRIAVELGLTPKSRVELMEIAGKDNDDDSDTDLEESIRRMQGED